MKRRNFLKTSAVAGIAAPAIAQDKTELVIVSSWPRDFPGLGLSAQRLAARITELSDGKIETQYFASGERVGGFDVFDEVAGGNSQEAPRLRLLHRRTFWYDQRRVECVDKIQRWTGTVG